ncbi:hypothetical protein J6590_100537 [Homalodisca vitripennis]|nr:hypothetical protein J6590_100537 [Homalodisca vitripennis]
MKLINARRLIWAWTLQARVNFFEKSKQREALRSGQASRDLTHSENFVDPTTGAHTHRESNRSGRRQNGVIGTNAVQVATC